MPPSKPTTNSSSVGSDFSQLLLDISLSALAILRPLTDPDSNEWSDFVIDYLNPAGQRMLRLADQPAQSYLAAFPGARDAGVFDFYRRVFETGEKEQFEYTYQQQEQVSRFCIVAYPHEDRLAVSFTDTTVLPQSAVEVGPLEVPACEQGLLTPAETQNQLLLAVLKQVPAGIGLFQGEGLTIAMANEQLCTMWGRPASQVLDRPLLEALPELQGQGFDQILAEVAKTGVSYVGTETPAQLLRHGQLETHYFNFVYQPLYNTSGEILGILNLAVDVTKQVTARWQVQQLNAVLEARVAERTQAALAAQAIAEMQRGRLERFFMAVPAAICILNGSDLVHELVNPTYQELFADRQLLGKPLLEAVPELTGTVIYRELRQVYETGVVRYRNTRTAVSRAESGLFEGRYFNSVFKPKRDEHGHIDGLVLFGFEITQQVVAQRRAAAMQAELLAAARQQLQAREAFYQIFEQTPALIALLRGPDHCYEYYNPAYQRLFPDRLMRGRTSAEARPELMAQGFGILLDRVYQTGETYFGSEVLAVIKQPDEQQDQQRYFDLTYQAYQENGQIVGVAIFAFDVTAQVLGRQLRATQQQRLRELFEQAPISICLFSGPTLVYEMASQQHQQLFEGRQLLGRPLLEAVPELTNQPVWHDLQRVYQTGETIINLGMRVLLVRQAGAAPEEDYFDYIFQARYNDEGTIDGVLVFAFEVTEQVRSREQVQALNQALYATNQELVAANQLLTRANSDLATFIYTASHDLKTPIANIEGLVDLLRNQLGKVTEQEAVVASALDMMEQSVKRFQLTIAQLTDISRLQQTTAQPAVPIDLADLVERIRLDLASQMAATQAQVFVDVDTCPTLSFAPKNLRSILYNLLSNAIKYHKPNQPPVVHLRAYPDEAGATIKIEVQDNGLGLRPDQQAKLFGMFQRLHDHVEGAGIGLYMVKKIIENAGGTITVHSELGQGSTFTVSLPALNQ